MGRIFPFDRAAAEEATSRAAELRAAGRTVDVDFRDIKIAGIVSARRATLATRSARHFQDLGIELVDPGHGARACVLLSLAQFRERLFDLAIERKAADGLFRENQLAVCDHV